MAIDRRRLKWGPTNRPGGAPGSLPPANPGGRCCIRIQAACILAGLVWIGGCAAKKPVLYPNAHLEQVGQQQAQVDIEQCMQTARSHGVKDSTGEKAVKDTAKGAAVGAAAGGAVAAVWGGDVGRSAAAGGAGAAAGTAVAKMFDSGGPDSVFEGFVNQCLRDKGYQVAGWQ